MNNRFPEWVLKYKRPGTELRCIRGKYYLYEAYSKWDKAKKRARKISGKCLGAIYVDGFKQSKNINKIIIENKPINIKMYGGYLFFIKEFQAWIQPLQTYFPQTWSQIFCLSFMRLFHRCPIKIMPFYFERSFFSEHFKNLAFSDKTISKVLHGIGVHRSSIEAYLKEFITVQNNVVLIDATPIFTQSKNMYEAKLGYNNKKRWENQVNLLYLYDHQLSMPLYYRIIEGDIREIRTLGLTIASSGLKNAIIVGDKGFTSELNKEIISQSELNYILPLKRNSLYIDYTKFSSGTKDKMDGYFKFKDRYIWYKAMEMREKNRVIIFLDEQLRISEERDYLERIEKHPEEYNKEGFLQNQNKMGTLAIIDNIIEKEPVEVYQIYKSRCEVEQLFDVFKNTLDADRTYMHSFESLQGWMFINHLAVSGYYRVYKMLKDKELLEKISVDDFIAHLLHINMININQEWVLQELSKKTGNILTKCNIELPITWNRES
jgi:transposase